MIPHRPQPSAPPSHSPAPFAEPPPEEGFDARRVFHVLLHHRWILITCTAVALVLAVVYLRKSLPVYSATTRLKYEDAKPNMVSFAELDSSDFRVDEIRTQIEIIRSPRLIRRVIDSLGLATQIQTQAEAQTKSFAGTAAAALRETKNRVSRMLVTWEPEAVSDEVLQLQRDEAWLRENLRVSRVEETRVIEISVTDGRRQRAAEIADEFARQYILSLEEEQAEAYRDAEKWFRQQVEDARKRLEAAENSLYEYKGQTDIRVLQHNMDIATDTLKTLSTEIEQSNNEIARLAAENNAADNQDLQRSLLGSDPGYLSLRKRLEELELKRASLVAENTEMHPDVRKVTREMEVLGEQMTGKLGELVREGKAREQLARARLEATRQRLKEQESLVQSLQKEMIQFNVLKREVESTRQIYDALLDRSKQVAVTAKMDPPKVVILSKAKIPEYPSSPKITQSLLLFLVAGFGAGVGLILLVNRLDRSVRDPRQLELRFGLPTLGQVPFLKPASGGLFQKRKGGRSPLVMDFDPNSGQVEAFRVLRTAIQYSAAGKPPQILLLSSCLPQEGKSTVVANLAISMAQRGDKVLLIDADLKLPVQDKIFGTAREPGLSDVLTGNQSAESLILPTGVDRLSILPAGPAVPSPADLLESDVMAELLTRLRKEYKTILIDSPPLSGIADALVLCRVVDGVCLVVHHGKTELDVLSKVISTLDQLQAPLLGIIYNARNQGSFDKLAMYGYPVHSYGYGSAQGKAGR